MVGPVRVALVGAAMIPHQPFARGWLLWRGLRRKGG